MIELEQISKHYATSAGVMTALDNITLSIQRGEIFGIIGQSGAGKSTLLRCINGLEQPDQGQVRVADKTLSNLSAEQLRQLRQQIGMIFQHFNLINNKTVTENIALPLKLQGISQAEQQQKVEHLLNVVGLSAKASAYPNQLSGGQKQRVAIARALSTSAQILLCDEATSALDPQTTQSILELLTQINQQFNLTIVLITHEMSVIKKICHRAAVLEQGKLIEQANVVDLFSQPKYLIHEPLPKQIAERIHQDPQGYPLVMLSFVGDTVGEPCISSMTRELNIDANLLQGNIEYINNTAVGFMIIELLGEKNCLQQAKQFFIEKNINMELLGYVDRLNP